MESNNILATVLEEDLKMFLEDFIPWVSDLRHLNGTNEVTLGFENFSRDVQMLYDLSAKWKLDVRLLILCCTELNAKFCIYMQKLKNYEALLRLDFSVPIETSTDEESISDNEFQDEIRHSDNDEMIYSDDSGMTNSDVSEMIDSDASEMDSELEDFVESDQRELPDKQLSERSSYLNSKMKKVLETINMILK